MSAVPSTLAHCGALSVITPHWWTPHRNNSQSGAQNRRSRTCWLLVESTATSTNGDGEWERRQNERSNNTQKAFCINQATAYVGKHVTNERPVSRTWSENIGRYATDDCPAALWPCAATWTLPEHLNFDTVTGGRRLTSRRKWNHWIATKDRRRNSICDKEWMKSGETHKRHMKHIYFVCIARCVWGSGSLLSCVQPGFHNPGPRDLQNLNRPKRVSQNQPKGGGIPLPSFSGWGWPALTQEQKKTRCVHVRIIITMTMKWTWLNNKLQLWFRLSLSWDSPMVLIVFQDFFENQKNVTRHPRHESPRWLRQSWTLGHHNRG